RRVYAGRFLSTRNPPCSQGKPDQTWLLYNFLQMLSEIELFSFFSISIQKLANRPAFPQSGLFPVAVSFAKNTCRHRFDGTVNILDVLRCNDLPIVLIHTFMRREF